MQNTNHNTTKQIVEQLANNKVEQNGTKQGDTDQITQITSKHHKQHKTNQNTEGNTKQGK